jgi:hypothetical protein
VPVNSLASVLVWLYAHRHSRRREGQLAAFPAAAGTDFSKDRMADAGEFPFRGPAIWLAPERGGRATGPPVPRPVWPYYAATAYVPQHTADTGLASFILRNFGFDHFGNQVVQLSSASWIIQRLWYFLDGESPYRSRRYSARVAACCHIHRSACIRISRSPPVL